MRSCAGAAKESAVGRVDLDNRGTRENRLCKNGRLGDITVRVEICASASDICRRATATQIELCSKSVGSRFESASGCVNRGEL